MSEGEWKSKTIDQIEIKGSVWKAEKLKAPDGTLMISVRRYAVNQQGKEIRTNQGIVLPLEGSELAVRAIINLFNSLPTR